MCYSVLCFYCVREAAAVDYAFYRKFWSLQDFFRDPVTCYSKPQWKKFTGYSETVLAAFRSLKLDDAHLIKQRLHKLQQISRSSEHHNFFAKYLTSEKVLSCIISCIRFMLLA